jgi:hypothetical protein
MQKITLLVFKAYKSLGVLVPGAFIFAMFQFPLTSPITNPNAHSLLNTGGVTVGEVTAGRVEIPMAETFFGKEAALKKTQEAIEQKIAFVSSRKAYPASLAVIQRHEKTIKQKAAQNGVPEDVAIGVGLLENGGSDTAKSPAGALGVFQLMPGTARGLGLKVDKKIDERRDPVKNIDAGMRYLKGNFETFGDWGLATWAYHAGEGNVSKAIKLYAKANHGVTLKGMKDQAAMRAYVEKHSVTVHKLLSDPAVKKFTNKLKDDSSGYPFKVVATATLFKEAAKAQEVVSR